MNARRWAFAGGGTGGHIVPGRHLLDEVERRGQLPEELLWFCSGREVEDSVLGAIEARWPGVIQRQPLRLEPEGGGAPGWATLARRVVPAVRAARRALRAHSSDLLVGLGGFTSVPAVLAARSLGIPVYLLEVNAVAGKATRLLGSQARLVFHAFPSSVPASPGNRHVHVGPIVGPSFSTVDEAASQAWRRDQGIPAGSSLLLVLGGSQGAAGLNRFLAAHAAELCADDLFVLHQVGPGRLDEAAKGAGGYRAVEYVADVATALATADGVLCRGGASTLAEVHAAEVQAWVVPYPHHPDQHQARNAEALGLRVIQEDRLDASVARELRGALLAPSTASIPEVGGGEACARIVEALLARS